MINQSTLQTTTPLKMYLLVATLLVAILGTMAAVLLSGRNADTRNKAATINLCAAAIAVGPTQCNGICGTNEDCVSGQICYRPTGGTSIDGLCRNPNNPTSTTCSGPTTPPSVPPVTVPPTLPPPPTVPPTTPPTSTPIACVKLCTYDYDCDSGYYCDGSNFDNTVDAKETGRRAATASELAQLAPDQPIGMGPGNQTVPDSKGVLKFSVISRQQTTFFIRIFEITGPKGSLDPQKQVFNKEFTIGANQVVMGDVYLPRCGRYQVDYGSNIVIGTPYDANPLAHYFWGTVFDIPCQNGCCEPIRSLQTITSQGAVAMSTVPATNASGLAVFKLSAMNSSGQRISALDPMKAGAVINKAVNPTLDILAHNFPSQMPAYIASVKFVVDGRQVMIDNNAPFTISGDTGAAFNISAVPAGSHTLIVTPYTGKNATGIAGKSVSVTLQIQ